MNVVSRKYQLPGAPSEPPRKGSKAILLFFLMLTILGFYAYWEGVDFIVKQKPCVIHL